MIRPDLSSRLMASTLVGGLFEGESNHVVDVRLDGSAKKAREVDPPFQRLVFIEPHKKRHAALAALKAANPHRDIECFRDDGPSGRDLRRRSLACADQRGRSLCSRRPPARPLRHRPSISAGSTRPRPRPLPVRFSGCHRPNAAMLAAVAGGRSDRRARSCVGSAPRGGEWPSIV